MMSRTLLHERVLSIFSNAEKELVWMGEYRLTLSYIFANGAVCIDRAPLGPLTMRIEPGSEIPLHSEAIKVAATEVIDRTRPVGTLTICQDTGTDHVSLIGTVDSLWDRYVLERRLVVRGRSLRLGDFTDTFDSYTDTHQYERYVGLHLFDEQRSLYEGVLASTAMPVVH